MASEPTEEAIADFVGFTSTTREQAIDFLKANNLDSQKAINAYFEDPTGSQLKPIPTYWNDNRSSSWDFAQQDNAPPIPATAPPSRPPSRTDIRGPGQNTGYQDSIGTAPKEGSGQGLSLAEREEKELQQAVAMSLNSEMGQQETGVTLQKQPQFSKATRDHYEEGAWAMTLFNTSSEEVMISPDPEDRKRAEGEPAFIRPNPEGIYLGGLLTILHSIPLAREALLLRNKPLFDYGHDPQWWNGQPINLPKIVTVNDGKTGDDDWDDIIHETQRLMAFMDTTKRAFGSSGSLAKINSMSSLSADSEEVVTRFLEAWHGAAIKADPENPLATIFTSHAYRKEPFHEFSEPDSRELFTFEPPVEQDNDQTLYDVLDSALWGDRPGKELDDAWLEHLAEVLVVRLDALQKPKPVGVDIHSVFYPDRYLSSCRDLAREFRAKRQQIQGDVLRLEQLIHRYTMPRDPVGSSTITELLEQAAQSVAVVAPGQMSEPDQSSSGAADAETTRVAEELRAISTNIEAKLKELELRKQSAMKSLREISKTLTEPPKSPFEPPVYKYTLRGVCTEPHVTYVLSNPKTTAPGHLMDMDSETEKSNDYQWWRISFSAEDGKARQAEKQKTQGNTAATQDGEVVGYTVRKVQENEVLQAAREEWSSVLLVYASENAVNAQVDPAPSQLQGFVNRDNDAFGDEFGNTPTIIFSDQEDSGAEANNAETQHKGQQPDMSEKATKVNVFDYEVSGFDDEPKSSQEMQEKPGASLLGHHAAATHSTAPIGPQTDSGWNSADEEMAHHLGHAK
ncbi:hypothetical protein E8E15_004729 [Penicillium rubens]|uniref:Ubiquitin interaction motif protein n=1 Tax=Penicillium chrysogenum TaxID=5076 RepID=A0A167VW72_PENCH|nr:uncharacterized protein N7525_004749 [Penicillium rubens]KZN90970.1 hypothetical protein EN45_010930 [Penicillium chrysogenum]KAF3027300.1 hypothetical protein E8E15_004729 [Penicillium rubens]KAJ5044508.1 hypothetical protein NUH16_001314 [Penicillium rubens]KAJ5839561.1 hypothetical protein N7525_004749 [Penicillium rubens]KAJ5867558.1 hypothetical protein N7534_002111 [Penicillium rubens]